jgi:glycosyltransferase involved in cell wall biosynthesis
VIQSRPVSSIHGLSAVVAVKNEAHQIRECLEQLSFADELVVVDMGSTDGTLEIARDLADKVLVHDGGPHGLIHVNKNVGFDAAAGPWILNLDADERLTPALRDEIVAAIAAAKAEVAAFSLPFTHYFFGKYLRHGGFRGSLVRLFRKGKLRYPEDRAHSSPQVDGTIEPLQNLVVHFNHRRIADFVQKMNLYTSSDSALMVEHGRGGLRNRALPARLGWKMISAPPSVFWNRYVRHAGFLDGVHGFVAAVLLGFYQFVEYAKVWEICNVTAREAESGT